MPTTLLLLQVIPRDVAADVLSAMVDARDLARLPLAPRVLGELLRGRRFYAKRVLTASELAWFQVRDVQVRLFQERQIWPTRDAGVGDNTAMYYYQNIFIGGVFGENRRYVCVYLRNGELHHEGGGAAVESNNGDLAWYFEGTRHRENDLPAVEWANGDREWRVKDGLHRENDKPAVERADGGREWWVDGNPHRDNDQPAFEDADSNCWWVDGKRHRDGGRPAVENTNGHREWFVRGQRHRDGDLPAVEYINGRREWYVHGRLHRGNDLPAIEAPNGLREWWVKGKRHRDNDLPAIEWADGDQEWWVDGTRHREDDRPAVVRENGHRCWWFYRDKSHRRFGRPHFVVHRGVGGGCDFAVWWHNSGRLVVTTCDPWWRRLPILCAMEMADNLRALVGMVD